MSLINTLTPKQLRRAADIQERILALQDELSALLGAAAATAEPETGAKTRKHKFSAAGLAAIRAGAKRRWAKQKGVKTSEDAVPKKRKFSAASRRRLAELAKARWARVKAEGQSRL